MLNNWRFFKKQYDYIHNLISIYLLLYTWSSTLSCVSCSINDPEEYFSSTDIRERANLWCITIFLLNGGQKWFNTKWLKRNSRIQIKNAVWSCKDRFFKTKPKRVCVNVQWEQVWPETDVTVLTDDFFGGGIWNKHFHSSNKHAAICLTMKVVFWMSAVHHCSSSSLRWSAETRLCSLSDSEIGRNDDVADSTADHAALRTSRWEVENFW